MTNHRLKPQPTPQEMMERKRKRKAERKPPATNHYLAQQYGGLKYDYGQIDEAHREQIQTAALDIKRRLKRTVEDMIEIGLRLNEVQGILDPEGKSALFYEWAQGEFELSRGSIFEFCQIARRFAENRSIIERFFSPTIVRRLAAVSVPYEAVQLVIEAAEASQKPLRVKEATAIIKPFLPPRQMAAKPEPTTISAEYTVLPKDADHVAVAMHRDLAKKLQDALVNRIFRVVLNRAESDELRNAITRALGAPVEE